MNQPGIESWSSGPLVNTQNIMSKIMTKIISVYNIIIINIYY